MRAANRTKWKSWTWSFEPLRPDPVQPFGDHGPPCGHGPWPVPVVIAPERNAALLRNVEIGPEMGQPILEAGILPHFGVELQRE